ncbi:MAG: DNA polymerase IV [bacterium]|nr:DNA polymerase IV [bacterium]
MTNPVRTDGTLREACGGPHPEPRLIFHVDMDAFFASVEQLDDPGLRGRPVIVGADPRGGTGRGVVSAASYEARRFGIASAMPISKAFRLCPEGAFVRPRFDRYVEISGRIMALLSARTPLLETAGLDEAYLDMTGTGRLSGSPLEAGSAIKREIRESEGLTASVGIGCSKTAAKIASDFRKPDGLVWIPADDTAAFLRPLPVGRIPGVGPKTRDRLARIGIIRIGDLQDIREEDWIRCCGKGADWLRRSAFGDDDSPVSPEREVRSVSNETTFEKDTADPEFLRSVLLELSERVGLRLRRGRLSGRVIELKMRFENFETLSRRVSLQSPTNLSERVFEAVLRLAGPALSGERKVRLLGVGVTGLSAEKDGQTELFVPDVDVRRGKLNRAADRLRDKFGDGIVTRATGLE